MKYCFSCLLVLLALQAPAQAQSPASGQVPATSASVQNEAVLRNLGEGYAALQRNELQIAEKNFLVVRRMDPNNIWGALNLAVVLQRQSRFAEAWSMYNEVLAMDRGTDRAAQASQSTYVSSSPADIARANMAMISVDALGAPKVAASKKCMPPLRGPSLRVAAETTASGCTASIADIRFVFNKAEPTPEGKAVLEAMPAYLRQVSALRVRGYTDDQGDEAFNRPLAEKRATYVAEWLERHGVRVTSKSAHSMCCYLTSQPTLKARQANRRVEVEFVQE